MRKVNPNNHANQLGTVLVEVINEEKRALIMKNKQLLSTHNNPTLRSLDIKNAKSKERMFAENCTYSLLKMNHGDDFYITGNGMIKRKSLFNQHGSAQSFSINQNNFQGNNNFTAPTLNSNSAAFRPSYLQPVDQQIPHYQGSSTLQLRHGPSYVNSSQQQLQSNQVYTQPRVSHLGPPSCNSGQTQGPPPGFQTGASNTVALATSSAQASGQSQIPSVPQPMVVDNIHETAADQHISQ